MHSWTLPALCIAYYAKQVKGPMSYCIDDAGRCKHKRCCSDAHLGGNYSNKL